MSVARSRKVIGGPSGVLVRRRAFQAIGGFDTGYAALADWDLWLRLLAAGRALVCDEVLSAYVVHTRGMHMEDARRVLAEFRRLQRDHSRRAPAEPAVAEQEFMRWIARTHLRAGRRRAAAAGYLANAWRFRDGRDAARGTVSLLGEAAFAALRRRWLVPRPPGPAWLDGYREGAGGLGLGPLRTAARRTGDAPAMEP